MHISTLSLSFRQKGWSRRYLARQINNLATAQRMRGEFLIASLAKPTDVDYLGNQKGKKANAHAEIYIKDTRAVCRLLSFFLRRCDSNINSANIPLLYGTKLNTCFGTIHGIWF